MEGTVMGHIFNQKDIVRPGIFNGTTLHFYDYVFKEYFVDISTTKNGEKITTKQVHISTNNRFTSG